MKRFVFLISIVLGSCSLIAQAADPDQIVGVWKSPSASVAMVKSWNCWLKAGAWVLCLANSRLPFKPTPIKRPFITSVSHFVVTPITYRPPWPDGIVILVFWDTLSIVQESYTFAISNTIFLRFLFLFFNLGFQLSYNHI